MTAERNIEAQLRSAAKIEPNRFPAAAPPDPA